MLSNLSFQTSTSVRSVLISYHRISSARGAINNSCRSSLLCVPELHRAGRLTAVSGQAPRIWHDKWLTSFFQSIVKEDNGIKCKNQIPKQNGTVSFSLLKCLLWAYFRPITSGHFLVLPSPLRSSHSPGHLRLSTDQYEQFLEKYDVSMTTKPQILSGKQWDQ